MDELDAEDLERQMHPSVAAHKSKPRRIHIWRPPTTFSSLSIYYSFFESSITFFLIKEWQGERGGAQHTMIPNCLALRPCGTLRGKAPGAAQPLAAAQCLSTHTRRPAAGSRRRPTAPSRQAPSATAAQLSRQPLQHSPQQSAGLNGSISSDGLAMPGTGQQQVGACSCCLGAGTTTPETHQAHQCPFGKDPGLHTIPCHCACTRQQRFQHPALRSRPACRTLLMRLLTTNLLVLRRSPSATSLGGRLWPQLSA